MHLHNITSIITTGPLSDNLKVFGNFIRKLRTNKDLTIEAVAAQSFLRPETLRKLEAGKTLPICDEDIRRLESSLGCKRNSLILKANEHRSFLVQFIETYHDQIVAMVDALRIYHNEEIDKILNETVFKWTQNSARKESEESMATTRRMTPMTAAKPAAKPATKRATKVAPTKRATTPAKTAAPRRASSSRSTKR